MSLEAWKVMSAVAALVFATSGCAGLVTQKFQTVSAGYTGCLPADNAISNIGSSVGGSTWNATCKVRPWRSST